MSEKSETYRLHMLRRLQNRYSKNDPPEMLEAEKVIAELRAQKERDRAAIARLSAPLPDDDLCPACFFMHGQHHKLVAVLHPTEPDKFDRWICLTCNHVDDIDARPGMD